MVISCLQHMSKTFTESRNLKQTKGWSLKAMLETIKNNLNARMNHIGYIHVNEIFLVSNDKNISEV